MVSILIKSSFKFRGGFAFVCKDVRDKKELFDTFGSLEV